MAYVEGIHLLKFTSVLGAKVTEMGVCGWLDALKITWSHPQMEKGTSTVFSMTYWKIIIKLMLLANIEVTDQRSSLFYWRCQSSSQSFASWLLWIILFCISLVWGRWTACMWAHFSSHSFYPCDDVCNSE